MMARSERLGFSLTLWVIGISNLYSASADMSDWLFLSLFFALGLGCALLAFKPKN
jgi:hypothetical protein